MQFSIKARFKYFFSVQALLLLASLLPLTACDLLGHVSANVPESRNFDNYLKRDLRLYFLKIHPDLTKVEFELLRRGATQSGVAYPKFYAWIKVYKDRQIIEQGAARVAAIAQTEFDVTHFLSEDEIRKEPNAIYSVFPAALCPNIIERANHNPG